MNFYDVEVECMSHCYGGRPKFEVEPYGYGEWAKREDVELLIAENEKLQLLREDLEAASGELLVPCPIPGSIESKMLIANRLLKSERDRLAAELAATNAAYAALLESHEILLDALTESDETLEKLRACELDPAQDGDPYMWTRDDLVSTLRAIQAILHPQPKETTT